MGGISARLVILPVRGQGPNVDDERMTRQERREARRLKRQRKMQHHGKGLARVYRDAVLKRLRKR